ncbi:MAG: type II secretion system secretin GspD [Myxococcales bacterium]|nr:type II secretion system secretin GspD [Myxococcales bacterium]
MKRSLLLTLSLSTLTFAAPARAQLVDKAPRLIPQKMTTVLGARTLSDTAKPPAAAAAPGAAPVPAPASPGAGTPATPPAGGAAGTLLPNGKVAGDTSGLTQFEQGVQYEPRSPNYLVSFSLDDADLSELVRVIAQLTGKRFIFGGKLKTIKATVYSPQKVTVAEAYQAFLSILETNGLTVVPHGRFFKIIETAGSVAQGTPVYGSTQAATAEDRYITRIHRLAHVSADDAANVLGKFKSKDADITVHAPGNLLIITDTGANIRRMMHLLEEIDVGGAGEQVFIEPINYASASDIAQRVNELFDVKGSGGSSANTPAPKGAAPKGAAHGADRIAKIVADERTNAVIIVATEKAYLRILELVKRLDVPQTGEGQIHVLPLQHADSVELSKTLGDIITGAKGGEARRGAAGGGANPTPGVFEGGIKVSADKATNSLVITSSLRDYASLRAVIDRLDQPRRQVFIEAVIMDLQLKRSDAFGVSFHGGSDFATGGGDGLVYGGNKILNTITPIPTDPDALQGFALGVRGPGISGTSSLLGTGISVPAFGSFIQALARTGDSDLLSTPHILALDNEKAEISVGDNIPLQTNAVSAFPGLGGAAGGAAGALGALGGLGGLGTVGSPRQDVGTKITITPHLNESNDVRLDVVEDISEQGAPLGGTLGAIPISKRTANTKLVVRDQQTVVIGGLLRSVVSRAEEKIPVLGDIPVLGALFRKRQNTLEKRNLVLILTPYIIRSQDDLRTVFERKMQERQEFLDRYFVFSDNEYAPPRDYSRLNGLVEDIRQAYFGVEERKRLDEITRPKELKSHEPQRPLEMPSGVRSSGEPAGGGAPAADAPAAPAPQPGLTLPRIRSFDKVER